MEEQKKIQKEQNKRKMNDSNWRLEIIFYTPVFFFHNIQNWKILCTFPDSVASDSLLKFTGNI